MHRNFERFFNGLTAAASTIPTAGGPISLIMDKWLEEKTTSIDNILFLYFGYLIKKTRVNLIIDNYQFFPNSIKKALEIGINQFNYGFTLFVIERTKGTYNHEKSFCSTFYHDFCDLKYISYKHYEQLIETKS